MGCLPNWYNPLFPFHRNLDHVIAIVEDVQFVQRMWLCSVCFHFCLKHPMAMQWSHWRSSHRQVSCQGNSCLLEQQWLQLLNSHTLSLHHYGHVPLKIITSSQLHPAKTVPDVCWCPPITLVGCQILAKVCNGWSQMCYTLLYSRLNFCNLII